MQKYYYLLIYNIEYVTVRNFSYAKIRLILQGVVLYFKPYFTWVEAYMYSTPNERQIIRR